MKPVYIQKDSGSFIRKIMMDMAFLSEHKQIRLYKYLFEDGLYFLYSNHKKDGDKVEKFFLTKDKVKKEDINYMYFELPSGCTIR